MKREIKFRAWDSSEKQMYQPDFFDGKPYAITAKGKVISIFPDCWEETSYTSVRELTDFILMQYTGLKDKNGKEIYEGDILEARGAFTLIEPAVLEVKPDEDGGFLPMSDMWASGGQIVPMYASQTFEVIGNIYENPELLKQP